MLLQNDFFIIKIVDVVVVVVVGFPLLSYLVSYQWKTSTEHMDSPAIIQI